MVLPTQEKKTKTYFKKFTRTALSKGKNFVYYFRKERKKEFCFRKLQELVMHLVPHFILQR